LRRIVAGMLASRLQRSAVVQASSPRADDTEALAEDAVGSGARWKALPELRSDLVRAEVNGIHEVAGSIPARSTKSCNDLAAR